MNHATNVIDERPSQSAGHVWRATGVVFLVVSLLGLAAGAFWEFFLPVYRTLNIPNPPTLQVLISVQAVFLVMFWPLLMGQRRYRRIGAMLFRAAVKYVIFLAASVPLYVIAAWLSDATATDVIRSLLYLSAVAAGALGMGLWVRTGRTAIITAVTLAGALIGLGGPVMYYLLAELTDAAGSVGWLWWASPATCAFESAAARAANWYPTPIWAWSLWPVVGAVLTFAFLLVGSDRSAGPAGDHRDRNGVPSHLEGAD